MADPVAIVSVAASATVAVGVAFMNVFSQARLARREALRDRTQGLREILDEALDPLFHATIKMQFALRARSPAAFGGQRFFSPMPPEFDPAQAIRDADTLRIDVWLWEFRLQMRLGAEHPIVQRYGQAMLELRRASEKLAGSGDQLERARARIAWHHIFAAQQALSEAAQGVIRLEEDLRI